VCRGACQNVVVCKGVQGRGMLQQGCVVCCCVVCWGGSVPRCHWVPLGTAGCEGATEYQGARRLLCKQRVLSTVLLSTVLGTEYQGARRLQCKQRVPGRRSQRPRRSPMSGLTRGKVGWEAQDDRPLGTERGAMAAAASQAASSAASASRHTVWRALQHQCHPASRHTTWRAPCSGRRDQCTHLAVSSTILSVSASASLPTSCTISFSSSSFCSTCRATRDEGGSRLPSGGLDDSAYAPQPTCGQQMTPHAPHTALPLLDRNM